MRFSPITQETIPFLYRYLPVSRICDYTPGTIFMWTDYYSFEYCVEDDLLFIKGKSVTHDKTAFFPPFGSGDRCMGFKKIAHYCHEQDIEVFFSPVTEEALPQCGNKLKTEKLDIWSDYLYNASDLIGLVGKKYHAKRNHVNKFKLTYDWTFEIIDLANVGQALSFLHSFDTEGFSEMNLYEHLATIKAVSLWDKFRFVGGMLKVDGVSIGLSMGEYSGDTLVTHTEKADRSYTGAYEMLAYCFNNAFAKDCAFINREEDLGDEGLRQAKLSYHPVKMLNKFNVIVQD